MGIETKYDYIYYTVLTQDWFDEAERTLNTELTTERLVNAINNKLKRSNDPTLNIFKVDYSQCSDDIEYWIYRNVQHKEQPVFVQIKAINLLLQVVQEHCLYYMKNQMITMMTHNNLGFPLQILMKVLLMVWLVLVVVYDL